MARADRTGKRKSREIFRTRVPDLGYYFIKREEPYGNFRRAKNSDGHLVSRDGKGRAGQHHSYFMIRACIPASMESWLRTMAQLGAGRSAHFL